MTLATTIFAPLLEFLASQNADAARASVRLNFDTEGRPSSGDFRAFSSLAPIGNDILYRECCKLGSDSIIDSSDLRSEPHKYIGNLEREGRLTGGGKTGFIYTTRGGIIDLGHVRDYIDYTRFFANKFFGAENRGQSGPGAKVLSEDGDIRLVVAPRATFPSPIVAALMAAKLAYARAVWHEITSYFSAESWSAFSPEDNFSNALGTIDGFRAVLTPGLEFNEAADRELVRALGQLHGVVKSEAELAISYATSLWLPVIGFSVSRRNFDAYPAKPWLVTDIAVPGKVPEGAELHRLFGRPQAASITMPSHYNGVLLDSLAYLEIVNVRPEVQALVPSVTINSMNLPVLVEAIRQIERADEGADADSPGPPAPW